MDKLPFSVSDAARAKLAASLGPGQMLRVAIQGGGCAGMQYQFLLAQEADPEDLVAEFDGARVVVDPVSASYLEGSVLDYASSAFSSQFVLQNPNAQAQCGCGKSFAG